MNAPLASGTLFEIIKDKTSAFTQSEKKVARAILADYPAAGLQTVAELAKSSSVSGQTVIRFVASLGFDSFPAFHARLIEELKVRSATPVSRHEEHQALLDRDDILGQCHQNLSESLKETFSRLPEAEFSEAVAMLGDAKRPLLSTGGRSTNLLAQYLVLQLQQMRPKTSFLPSDRVSRAHALLELTSKSILFIYDFRRYSDATLRLAEEAHKKGAQIILVTDTYLSPISKYARVVLPVHVDFLTPFDSQLCGMAVTETLVAATTETLKKNISSRMESYEHYRNKL